MAWLDGARTAALELSCVALHASVECSSWLCGLGTALAMVALVSLSRLLDGLMATPLLALRQDEWCAGAGAAGLRSLRVDLWRLDLQTTALEQANALLRGKIERLEASPSAPPCPGQPRPQTCDPCASRHKSCKIGARPGYWTKTPDPRPRVSDQVWRWFAKLPGPGSCLPVFMPYTVALSQGNAGFFTGDRSKLGDKSMLLIGDSLDRNAVFDLCKLLGQEPQPYIALQMTERLFGSSYKFCTDHGLTVGQFMSYGVFEPPYWVYAYKDDEGHFPDGLQSTSVEHIRRDATLFRAVIGGKDPTIVVLQSYLWDLARHWMMTEMMEDPGTLPTMEAAEKKEGRDFRPGRDFLQQWTARVPAYVQLVRETFPRSRVVWRTAPPVPSQHGRNAEIIHDMNEVARHLGHTMGFEVVDFGLMLEGTNPEEAALRHGVHPSNEGNEAYMNVLLNMLVRVDS